jgi:hypothetical protein
MNKFRIWASLAVAPFLMAMPTAARAADVWPLIKDFKFGLVCGPANDRKVCFETKTIQVTNESTCVYNKSPVSCTWFGYSFEYVSPFDIKLSCDDALDVAASFGQPKKEDQASTKDYKFELGLAKGVRHFFNPNYAYGPAGKPTEHETLTCSYKGKQVFSVAFQIMFPAK